MSTTARRVVVAGVGLFMLGGVAWSIHGGEICLRGGCTRETAEPVLFWTEAILIGLSGIGALYVALFQMRPKPPNGEGQQ